jgi:hypothetical protein
MLIKPESFTVTDSARPLGHLQVFAFKGEKPTFSPEGYLMFNPMQTKLISKYADNNMVVESGRAVINRVMNGTNGSPNAADPISFISIGTGGYDGVQDPYNDPPPPQGTNADLVAQVFQKATVFPPEQPNAMSTKFVTTIETTEPGAGVSITEFGLKTSTGILFARRTTRPMWKDADVFFIVQWTIQF